MVSISQMRSLIERVCEEMGSKYAKKEAVDLVLATGIIESRYEYIKQLNSGPAASFHQVEPATAVDNCQHFLSQKQSSLSCIFFLAFLVPLIIVVVIRFSVTTVLSHDCSFLFSHVYRTMDQVSSERAGKKG